MHRFQKQQVHAELIYLGKQIHFQLTGNESKHAQYPPFTKIFFSTSIEKQKPTTLPLHQNCGFKSV